jgi:phosphate uptake regulator
MQKDAVSSFARGDAKLAHTVVERDEDVDRLYFLLVRVVRAALTDPAIADKLGTNPIDCLDYRILASLVENFADHATDIAESTWPRSKGKPTDGTIRSIEKAGDALNLMHKEAVEAVFARNLALAQEVAKLYDDWSTQSLRQSIA